MSPMTCHEVDPDMWQAILKRQLKVKLGGITEVVKRIYIFDVNKSF